jgi:hypothetical protein
MKKTSQIEGQQILKWIQRSETIEHALLNGSEFSNDDEILIVESIDRNWVEVKTAEGSQVRKRVEFIIDGVFFIEEFKSQIIEESLLSRLSTTEIALYEAKNKLSSNGFHIKELGDSQILFLFSLLLEFEVHSFPDNTEKWLG